MDQTYGVHSAVHNTWPLEILIPLLWCNCSIYQSTEGLLKRAFSLPPLKKIQPAIEELWLPLPFVHQCLNLRQRRKYATDEGRQKRLITSRILLTAFLCVTRRVGNIYRSTYWPIDRELCEWPADSLTEWLTDWLVDRVTDSLTDWVLK